VLFAIQDNTKFSCIENGVIKHILLSKGQFVIFDGDLVHAGAQYEKRNLRVHLYIDVPGVTAANTTYLLDMSYLEWCRKQTDRK
jgi:hypothetical protein